MKPRNVEVLLDIETGYRVAELKTIIQGALEREGLSLTRRPIVTVVQDTKNKK